jgi:hypothetical protein
MLITSTRRFQHSGGLERDECIERAQRFASCEQCARIALDADFTVRHPGDRIDRRELQEVIREGGYANGCLDEGAAGDSAEVMHTLLYQHC